jgi:hypothetical protein
VQIKSKAAQAELDDYLGRFRLDGSYDQFFFACHSPSSTLRLPSERGLHLWTGDVLANAIERAGLSSWLVEKSG